MIAAAEREGLLYEVHAPQMADAKDVMDADMKSESFAFAHGILDQQIGQRELPVTSAATSRRLNLFRYYISGGFYVPTYCVFEFLADTKGFMSGALGEGRFRNALPDEVVRQYESNEYYERYAKRYPNIEFVKSHLHNLDSNVMSVRWDRVVLGTDMWALPGIGEHLELEYMVHAGMTPRNALFCATNNGANFLGIGRTWMGAKPRGMLGEIGTLEPEKRADLLILDADPLDDIRNTRSVRTIIKHGKVFDHQQLVDESKQMK